jgi:hypothetical protein
MDRGWGIIEVHPWNLLGEFDLLFHPWKVYLFARLDDVFVLRLKHLFEASKSLEVGIIFGVLNPLNGAPQFHNCIDNCVRWRDHGLRDILMLEKNRVCQLFCPCLLAKNHVRSVMFHGRFQIKSITRMLTKHLLSALFDMKLYTATHGCNWHSIVIKGAVVIGISRDDGSHVRLAQ